MLFATSTIYLEVNINNTLKARIKNVQYKNFLKSLENNLEKNEDKKNSEIRQQKNIDETKKVSILMNLVKDIILGEENEIKDLKSQIFEIFSENTNEKYIQSKEIMCESHSEYIHDLKNQLKIFTLN